MKTVSLQLAKQLKKAGFIQGETYFLWYENGDKGHLIQQVEGMRPFEYKSFDAPTVEEILERLPSWIETEEYIYTLTISKMSNETYYIKYDCQGEILEREVESTLAEAAGKCWLYLKENHLLKEESQDK